MTPLFAARRRAERFDSMVESGRRDDVDRSTSDLLELVSTLRSVPESQARPEFVADLRERLMVAAVSELAPVTPAGERDAVARLTIKPARTRRERRVGIALGAFAIVGATTSMAVASQSAIPGDALYPVKRAIENTQAGFSVGDDAKGEAILGNASERLDEVDKLSHKSKPDAKLVKQTLNTYAAQFSDGSDALLADYEEHGDPASIAHVHQNAADGLDVLSGLNDVIPPAAHDALLNAAGAILAADTEALNLCADPACGEGILEVPAQLLAGAPQQLSDALNTLTGGQLAGTDAPTATPTPTPSAQPQHQGGKGHGKPSGMNPPDVPIDLPADPTATTTDLGGILPGGGGGTGTGTGGGGGGGPKGGKHHPIDLTPVTDTVNDVVTGVVQGVNGLLTGLAGKAS
jgi:uncharacterized protein DUF5667